MMTSIGNFENVYLLAYVRGPEGITLPLAQHIG
jgi:hypothetical protein